MPVKAYFIGLGGCGLKTVSELSRKLGPQNSNDPEYLFTYIDTDGKTLEQINREQILIYNQDFDPNTILIEVGGQYNYIEEVNNSLKVFANVLYDYLKGEL